MKNRGVVLVVVFAIATLCAPCVLVPTNSLDIERQEGDWRCSSLPVSFQEGDLVGTWQSNYYPGVVTDTLILQDGLYQQIYENNRTGEHYVSSWNSWYAEIMPDGAYYLHLEGMRYCLATNEICRREGGGGGSSSYYDPCADRVIWDMVDEVIVVVQGDEGFRYPGIESVPRSILLWHLMSNSQGTGNFFIVVEE